LIYPAKSVIICNVKADETEKADAFVDRKESSDLLREVSIVSRVAEEPNWEALVKKEMFQWVVIYGGAILVAAGLVWVMLTLTRGH
jgi:hypothetical protein